MATNRSKIEVGVHDDALAMIAIHLNMTDLIHLSYTSRTMYRRVPEFLQRAEIHITQSYEYTEVEMNIVQRSIEPHALEDASVDQDGEESPVEDASVDQDVKELPVEDAIVDQDGAEAPVREPDRFALRNMTFLLKLVLRVPSVASSVRSLTLLHYYREDRPFQYTATAELSKTQRTMLYWRTHTCHALDYGRNASVQRLLRGLHSTYEPADRAMDLLTVLLALLPNLQRLKVHVGCSASEEQSGVLGWQSCSEMVERAVNAYHAGHRDGPLARLKYLVVSSPFELAGFLIVMPALRLVHFKSCEATGDWEEFEPDVPWPRDSERDELLSSVPATVLDGYNWHGDSHTENIMERIIGPAVLINNANHNEDMWAFHRDMLHYTSVTKLRGCNRSVTHFNYWKPQHMAPSGGFDPDDEDSNQSLSWDLKAMESRFHVLAAPWLSGPLPNVTSYIFENRYLLGLGTIGFGHMTYEEMIDTINAIDAAEDDLATAKVEDDASMTEADDDASMTEADSDHEQSEPEQAE